MGEWMPPERLFGRVFKPRSHPKKVGLTVLSCRRVGERLGRGGFAARTHAPGQLDGRLTLPALADQGQVQARERRSKALQGETLSVGRGVCTRVYSVGFAVGTARPGRAHGRLAEDVSIRQRMTA
jgi:hypothetical protein